MKNSFYQLLLVVVCCFLLQTTTNAQQKLDSNKNYIAKIETSVGDITILLLNSTPLHLENFIKNIDSKLYEGMKFHRVISKFVIQTGDPGTKDPNYPRSQWGEGTAGEQFPPEFIEGVIHSRGAVGMAREGNDVNPERLSSGSHFYIVQGKNKISSTLLNTHEERLGRKYTAQQRHNYLRDGGQPRLDGEYVVFGYVIEGMDVVDQIAMIKTNAKDAPLQNVVIDKIKLSKITTKKLEKIYKYYAK